MFSQHRGGEAVQAGTYLNLRTGELRVMPRSGALPGGEQSRYVETSSLLLALIGPFLGLLFVIVLPIAAPAVLLVLLAKRIEEIIAFQRRPKGAILAQGSQVGTVLFHPLGQGHTQKGDEILEKASRIVEEVDKRAALTTKGPWPRR